MSRKKLCFLLQLIKKKKKTVWTIIFFFTFRLFTDCFSGEACKSASAMNERDYRRKTLTKSMQQRFLCPEVTNVTSRCLKTPNIGHIPDCTQWTDMRLPPLKVTNCPPSPPSPQPVKILQVPVLQAPLPLPLAKKKRWF